MHSASAITCTEAGCFHTPGIERHPSGTPARFPKIRSVRTSIIMMLVVCTGLVMALYTLYSFMTTRTVLQARQQQRAVNTLERLAFSTAGPLWYFDRQQLQVLFSYELRSPEIVSVQVFEQDGSLFFGLQRTNEGRIETIDAHAANEPAEFRDAQVLRREVRFGEQSIGELAIRVHDRIITEQLQELLNRQALQVLLVLVLVSLLAYLGLHHLLLVPLYTLHETTRAFAHGDLSRRSAVTGCNELGVLSDVLNRMAEQQQQNLARLQLLSTAVDQSANAVIITDASGRIEYVNPCFCTSTGYGIEEVIGRIPTFLKSDFHPPGFYTELWKTICNGTSWRGELCNKAKSGALFWELCSITPVRSCAGTITHFVAIKEDITARKVQEEQLVWLANHDPLTGLYNRYYLERQLDLLLRQLDGAAEERHLSVLILNIDNLKFVNNTFGHDVGDRLLSDVAARMKTVAGADCLIARFMANEFVVLPPPASLPAGGMELAEELRNAITRFFPAGGTEVMPTVSIGLVAWPQDGNSTATLLRNAQTALHESKRQGRNTITRYTHASHQRAQYRMRLESRLHNALEQQEFRLRYQPQVSAADGTLFGVETLLRWEPSGMPPVPTVDFIPILEEIGLVVPVGRWVLYQACRQAVLWQRRGMPNLRLSVNISAVQFLCGDLDRTIQTALDESGLEPGLLCLELTESMLLHDTANVRDRLDTLRKLGIKLALDDFGTGYSSLSYLSRLPVHELKVDQSFVRRLHRSDSDAALVNAIIMMGQELGLSLIAEGVETEYQKEYLIKRGCSAMQGYLFSHPLTSDEFEQFSERFMR